jgi:mono/diheme cytochrome c family protein
MAKRLVACAILWGFCTVLSAQAPAKVDFGRDIQPLFRTHCYSCHGPSQQLNGFRLDRRRDAMPNRVGANGARIVAGNGAGSRLYLKLIGTAPGLQMPPTGALGAEEINLIKTWIDQGAEWPDALAGDAPSPARDPRAARLMEPLRNGDRPTFRKLLREDPKAANAQGPGGSTPLMYGALYGDADSVRLLLSAGGDPNIRNDARATALMWAVEDAEKTRLLLEHGADANARSEDGQTPLLLAAGQAGSGAVVKLLLDHGAELKGPAVLGRAALAGDEALMRMLIERGADMKPLPLDLAVRANCVPCVDLLMNSASREDLNRAMAVAARRGDSGMIQRLLDGGADASGASPRPAAAADPASPAPEAAGKPAASVRAAVERSIPVLQRTDVAFLKNAGCVSCHNNSLTEMTVAAARKNKLPVDETISRSQLAAIGAYLESWRERVLQGIAIPGDVDTIGYILAGLAAANYGPDPATDALARFLKRRQTPDGGWRIASQRPPIESSDFEATAVALRAMQVYAPKPLRAEYEKAIQRGAAWLAKGQPQSTEDRVFQLLGLAWAGGYKEVIRKAASDLLAAQRSDGGWSQLPSLASDAYATGQALTALLKAGAVSATDAPYKRGVQFLLSTQFEDGSWYVRTRTQPVQPYFDNGFPHGHDQFISAAATNWATMALAAAAR